MANKQLVVRLAYVDRAEGVAMTQLAHAILTDKMGYEVELLLAEEDQVYAALAAGESDAFLDAWLPVSHAPYLARYSGQLVKLGVDYTDARIGLVVPTSMPLTQIPQLSEQPQGFQGQIIVIDQRAGVRRGSERALSKYQLPFKLVRLDEPAATAALKSADANDELVVIAGLKPHWMFARYPLKFLDDPAQSFGPSENIYVVTRTGFREELPHVAQFLERFSFTDEQLSNLLDLFEQQRDNPSGAARRWMRDHAELVNGWTSTGAIQQTGP